MRSTIWGNLAGAMNKRRAVSVAKPAAQVLPALTGAAPAERHRAPGAARTLSAAGALARSILWLSAGEPNAGCESRQSSESLQPAPCAPPAPGRSRPAARPAALARAVASARHAAAAVLVVAAALFFAAPAQAQTTTPVWSTTMTVGVSTGAPRGYNPSFNSGTGYGSLDDDQFEDGSNTVHSLINSGGQISLQLSLAIDQNTHIFEVAGEELPLSAAVRRVSKYIWSVDWTAANTLSLSNANYETTLAEDAEVLVCLRTAAQVCPGGTTTNAVPVFGEGATATRSVAENTAAGTDIGAPLTATDAENDSLEYTLEGADAASFDIVLGTGQLRTKTGVVYNYEAAKNSYSVTVKVDDGSGTATIAVTVNVTDVAEQSATPAQPVVTATPGTTDSLNVSWTKPDLAGGPDIVGYKVRHRVTGVGGWTELTPEPTDTMATISGLQSGTGYSVQVRAKNGETQSDWSQAGTGTTATTTTTNAVPVFGEGASAVREVEENTAAGTEIGAAVSATDADNDLLEYSLGGTDVASFDIDSDTGQLRTKTGVDYNHEAAKNSYSVTVEADDNNGGTATIAVTVDVTDVDERSRRPTMPVVMATPGTTDSLNVSWTKPGLVGGPDIVGYNVRHQVTGSGSWTTLQLTGTGLTTMISGLESDTDYTVQVQARNGETPSLWSLDGTGSTGTATTTTTTLPWSTTMTVGETTGDGRGYRSSGEQRPGGSLVTDSFTTGGVPYRVLRLDVSGARSAAEFKLNSELSSYADYTLEFAGETLPLASTTFNSSNQEFLFNDAWLAVNAPSLSLANFETTLAVDAMVSACLRTAAQVCPDGGTTTTNTDATGKPEITGTPQVGQMLTAGIGTIADAEDLPSTVFPAGYTFQWVQVDSSNNETDVGTDSSTYSPASSDVGSTIKVEVSFTDGGGNAETVTGDETAAVVAAATTANLLWSTTMTVGETTGLGRGYRSSGEVWPGGSLVTDFFTTGGVRYTVLRLEVSDHQGGVEFKLNSGLSSYADYTLEFAGETLPLASATNTGSNQSRFHFNDAWLTANAPSLSLANFETTLPVDAMVPVCLRTATEVCPDGGTTTTNTAATGQPGISGTAQVGQTLTATTSGISDADGKTNAENGDSGYAYTYQWILVDGNTETNISGETSSTYTPSSSDVGKTIRVRVSFTDDAGNAEGPLTSEQTAPVTVGVTDELPLAPAAPGVAKVGNSETSLKVTWRAPDNAGRPAIAHYNLRYRESGTGAGGWLEAPDDETGTSATIANLTENTQYDVQVRASNANGDGPWSPSGQGTPGVETAQTGDLRLVDGPTVDSGRLEAFYRGQWGTVCDDRFDSPFADRHADPPNPNADEDGKVPNVAPQFACQLMEYSTGEFVTSGSLGMTSAAPASQKIWLDDVRCAEGSTHWTGKPATKLHHCYNAGVGLENCTHEEDVHLRCFGSSTARAALSGEFQNVPESHDGTEFTFQAAFSEAVTASAEDLRDHAFDVTGGTVTEVSPVDARRDLWSVTVSPASSGDVTIALEGERACDTPGAVCAEDGGQLTNTVSVEIPGTPVTGDGITARFEDVPPQHDGETPFTLRLALSAPVRNSYTAMREDVLEATGGTVTRARRIDGRSDLWEITITPQGEGNVQLVLAAGRACGTPGALCTRDGRGLATGLMTLVPGPSTIGPRSPGPAPLTARFTNIPGEHDGESVFTLEIVFSEAPSGMKNRTLRNALRVTNGAVTRVRRVNHVSAHRIVTVQPTGHEAVDIELPVSPDCEAAGAICTGAGGRLETGLLTRVRGPAALRVADAEVHEGPGAVLAFAVTLDRATSAAVGVDYATSDGTAQAGSDYTAASGSVTFSPGEMAKTVSVAVLDDSHHEGSETLTLRLTNPSGAYLADAVATGTIENSDHMPKAWIARFGRTVGTQVVDALTQRLDGAGGSHVTVAGINLIGAKGEEPTLTDDDPFGLPQWAKNAEREADAQSITGEDLVLRSAFHLSSAGNAMQQGGAAFTAWGRVATGGFEAEEDDVTMDGDVTTGLVGFDAEWERGLAGIMLSRSSGDGSYRLDPAKGEDAGTVESSLTGVYPYARVDLNAKVSAWALAGMGSGELTLRQTGKKPMPTDISMRMGALGVKGQVLDGSGPSGVALNVKSDAMWVGTKSERSGDMIATQGDVMRLRLIMHGERTFEGGSGAAFTPSAEVGLRHDGGDAETGTGVEVGAGLRYSIGSVTIEARARTLLAHEASGYDEWGMSGAIRVTPAASGRGLTLSIAPAWGRTGSAAQRLWSAHDARGLGADNEFEADSRLDMEAGYGFGLPGSRGVLTPHAGMTLGDAGHRAIRTGARWQLSPDAVVGLEGTRQTSDAGEAATEVKLRAALRF